MVDLASVTKNKSLCVKSCVGMLAGLIHGGTYGRNQWIRWRERERDSHRYERAGKRTIRQGATGNDSEHNSGRTMKTGRSISMDSKVWTIVGDISESETDGDVSAAIEVLCREAFKLREIPWL